MKKNFMLVLLCLFAAASTAFAASESRLVDWEAYNGEEKVSSGRAVITDRNYKGNEDFLKNALKELISGIGRDNNYETIKIVGVHPAPNSYTQQGKGDGTFSVTRIAEYDHYSNGRKITGGKFNFTDYRYLNIDKFLERAQKELQDRFGKDYVVTKIDAAGYFIDLSYDFGSPELIELTTEKELCDRYKLTHAQFIGQEAITESLDFELVSVLPDGFNPVSDANMNFPELIAIPKGFNPTVNGYGNGLNLPKVTTIPQGFNPTVEGKLTLESVTAIPEGFNPTVGEDLWLHSVTTVPQGFKPKVGGDLILSSATTIPEGWEITIGGSLDLRNLKTIPKGVKITAKDLDIRGISSIPKDLVLNMSEWDYIYIAGEDKDSPLSMTFSEFSEKFLSTAQLSPAAEEFRKTHNLTVGEYTGKTPINKYMRLSSVTSLPEGFSPVVNNELDLPGLKSLPKGFNPTVSNNLNLSGLTSLPAGFSVTARNLDLSGLTSIPADFNPKVAGNLDLSNVTSLPAGISITVGGRLKLGSLTSCPKGVKLTAEEIDLDSLTGKPECTIIYEIEEW